MTKQEIIFLGTGNAFGHDGRRHSSYILRKNGNHPFTLLIDCGPSTLPALHQNQITPNDIDFVYLSHLHPDHWLGLALLVLDNKWITKRKTPLPLVCPIGTEDLLTKTCKILYSKGEAEIVRETYRFIETDDNAIVTLQEDLSIITIPATHGGNGRMAIIESSGKKIGYSGDSAFLEPSFLKLLECDLIIHEASTFDLKIPNHTTYLDLLPFREKITGRLFITHLDSSISKRRNEVKPPIYIAEDNMRIKL